MAEAPPYSMQGVCLSPLGLRQMVEGLVSGEGVSNAAAGDLLVTPSGADGSVSVAEGGAFVVGEDVNDQGMYYVFNDAPTIVGPLDANATGNPRIDLIVAQVSDSTYGALSDAWTLDHVTGTANASAALTTAGLAFAPAVPTDSLLLAYVLVPNGFGAGSTVSGANILDARTSYTPGLVPRWRSVEASGGAGPEIVFTNSWVNFGGSAQVAQYRKVGDVVEVRGVIKTGALGNSAFTLPVGYRPPAAMSFATDANGAYGRVTVATTGTVTPDIGAGVSTSTVINFRFSVTA
jgi:hypothetical protein